MPMLEVFQVLWQLLRLLQAVQDGPENVGKHVLQLLVAIVERNEGPLLDHRTLDGPDLGRALNTCLARAHADDADQVLVRHPLCRHNSRRRGSL
eukprot:2798306-Pyramimonas_sp.AAC.1